jgi:hypothetical protein
MPDTATIEPGPQEPGQEAPAPPGGRARRRPGPVWILPAVVVAIWLVFTALGIHGSSIAQLTSDPAGDPGVIAGNSRPVRSDEWNVRTPLIAGQVERDFDRYIDNGVGEHDMALQNDIPTADWSVALRPHLWGFFVLPLANGLAWDWWGMAAALILGSYALIYVLTGDWKWSALGSLILYGSPFFHWWYIPAPVAMVGYASGATACLIMSTRAERSWTRWAWVAGTVLLLCCFGVHTYPPFQIPTLLVMCAVVAGHVIDRFRAGGFPWKPGLVNLVVAGGATAVVMGAFFLTRIDTLRALANTVYPGQRRIIGGDGPVGHLASGWYSWVNWRTPNAIGTSVFGNASEASSFLFLGLFLLAALPFVWRAVAGRAARDRWTIIALVTLMIVMLVHAFVGLPTIVARVLVLDRVQESRVIIGLGIGSALLVVLVGMGMERAALPRWRRVLVGLVLAGVAGGYVLKMGQQYRDAGGGLGTASLAVTVLAAVVVSGLFAWRPTVGAAALVLVGLVLSVPVNPLYRGDDPLRPRQVLDVIEREDAGRPADVPDGWLTDMSDLSVILEANGVDDLSGVNLYPNVDAWRVLDPTGTYEQAWNRFSNTAWTFTPGLDGVVVTVPQADLLAVEVDPCLPALTELGVGHIVSSQPLEAECLVPRGTLTTPKGGVGYVYLRDPAGS